MLLSSWPAQPLYCSVGQFHLRQSHGWQLGHLGYGYNHMGSDYQDVSSELVYNKADFLKIWSSYIYLMDAEQRQISLWLFQFMLFLIKAVCGRSLLLPWFNHFSSCKLFILSAWMELDEVSNGLLALEASLSCFILLVSNYHFKIQLSERKIS